jgi:hypothetical protein
MDKKLKNSLITLLTLIVKKAESNGLKPFIKTSKVIDMLKSSGVTINYHQLSQLAQIPAVGAFIKNINKDQIELVTDDNPKDEIAPEVDDVDTDDEVASFEEPEETEEMPAASPDTNAVQDNNDTDETDSIKHTGADIVGKMAARALKRSG